MTSYFFRHLPMSLRMQFPLRAKLAISLVCPYIVPAHNDSHMQGKQTIDKEHIECILQLKWPNN